MIFNIEDAGGVICSLDIEAEAREPIGIVAQHGAVDATVIVERRLLDELEEVRQRLTVVAAGTIVAFFESAKFDPGAINRFPHFGGERGATARPLARANLMQLQIEDGLSGAKVE